VKILFDECMPRPLRRDLSGHEVMTVREMGWSGVENGDLLRLAETNFDVFITVDRNLQYQQNLDGYKIAMILLVAQSNRLESLQPLLPSIRKALETIKVGDVVRIDGDVEERI
jgi:predicted nuclease of predicted toxin-antitoxin system